MSLGANAARNATFPKNQRATSHLPLAAVATSGSACLRWLNRDQPDLASARDALSRIVRDAQRAGNVIHSLRALVQKSGPKKTELDMNDAIHEVLELSRSDLKQHGVVLHTTLSADVQPSATGFNCNKCC